MEYFKDLSALLKEELACDKEQHESLLQRNSLNERKSLGVTWFPIQISNSELGRGDYLTITVNKTSDLENAHRFRFGMPVTLFSNHAPKEDRIDGTIAFVNQRSMRISFRTEELPEWSHKGKLGVDLLFDENSYREMGGALTLAETRSKDPIKGQLIRQIIGIDALNKRAELSVFKDIVLNESQNKAVGQIIADNAITILHGPPGTGKTTTLTKAIQALTVRNEGQILVVAPSNTAVDVLTERLDGMGVKVLRIGSPVKVSEHLLELTLDAKASQHVAYREKKDLEKRAREYTEMAHKYKRSFGRAEYEQRKALLSEARKIRQEIDKIQDYVIQDVLDKAQVITATLVGSNHSYVKDRQYATVVIDEAGQALEPACWIPILKTEKLVLAGDHCQLPPTVKSDHRGSDNLYYTLFEKLIKRYPEAVAFLDTQYRMNTKIMQYSSTVLYQGLLKASALVKDWTLTGDEEPVTFIDTAGAGYEEAVLDSAISNKDEAYFLIKHLKSTLAQNKLSNTNDVGLTIGLITPYRAQVTFIKELLAEELTLKEETIQVNTIDGFQGQEKDIIYISLVRSNDEQNIGFLADIRRMNVALTRAKKKLVIIGDSSTIGTHTFYSGLLDYVESIKGYHSVWEWEAL